MSELFQRISIVLCVVALIALIAIPISQSVVYAETDESGVVATADETAQTQDKAKTAKAIAATVCVGLAAAAGALAMGIAISKSNEAVARQPEAGSQIRSGLMLGLVFIETAIIYALIVAILVIFVL